MLMMVVLPVPFGARMPMDRPSSKDHLALRAGPERFGNVVEFDHLSVPRIRHRIPRCGHENYPWYRGRSGRNFGANLMPGPRYCPPWP
jgi:hypothetical protein